MKFNQTVTLPQVEFTMVEGDFSTISEAFDISDEDFDFLKSLMADMTFDCYMNSPDTNGFIKKFLEALSSPDCSDTLRSFVLIQLLAGFKRSIERKPDNSLVSLLEAAKQVGLTDV